MEDYAIYIVALAAILAVGWPILKLFERSIDIRYSACRWTELQDAMEVSELASRARGRKVFVWSLLAAAIGFGGEYVAKVLDVPPLWFTIGAGAVLVYALVPYVLLPALMPRSTAIADIVQFTVGSGGQKAGRFKAALMERVVYNETMEKAPSRARALWKRAADAIVANDTSYSARNREIAEIHRCTEGGFPLPPVVEQRARRLSEQKWDQMLALMDELD